MKLINTILSLFLVAAIVTAGSIGSAQAQTKEERKEALKLANKRSIKIARKEAKQYEKKGFSAILGDPPIHKQLEDSYALHYVTNDRGQKKYFLTTQEAMAENYAAAKQQVYQLCLADFANQIGSEIVGKIKSNVANSEGLEDAVSVTEVIGAYQNRVAARLGRTEPVVVLKKKEGKYTYMVMTMKYDVASAEEMVRNDLRQELRDKANLQQEEIDGLLDLK
ncbi:hypothetical protein V6R21_18565 [Limibacter armeniacum]|uniref:hypothetical protein n=1 Tax=Limibacter armeniacum TaxID=466084 RepID=UPI002FE5FA76